MPCLTVVLRRRAKNGSRKTDVDRQKSTQSRGGRQKKSGQREEDDENKMLCDGLRGRKPWRTRVAGRQADTTVRNIKIYEHNYNRHVVYREVQEHLIARQEAL